MYCALTSFGRTNNIVAKLHGNRLPIQNALKIALRNGQNRRSVVRTTANPPFPLNASMGLPRRFCACAEIELCLCGCHLCLYPVLGVFYKKSYEDIIP